MAAATGHSGQCDVARGGWSPTIAAEVLLTVGLAVAALVGLAGPAHADDVSTLSQLEDAFADPGSVGGEATLTADIAAANTTVRLTENGTLQVDLAGQDLTLGQVVLGSGSELTVTDGTPATSDAGTLTAGGGGIRTTGATLTIDGTATVDATGGEHAAGMGGGESEAGGTVTISGNATVDATGGAFGAGIGGGSLGAGGTVTIEGAAQVSATGPGAGAGIGGGILGAGGTITISGTAQVDAAGGTEGAGIGGGNRGAGGTVTIEGAAQVSATGGNLGAGIGGGGGGDGGAVTIGGTATVNATGGTDGGAGIGGGGILGGRGGAGGAVEILDGAVVPVVNGPGASAVGPGAGGSGFGSLRVDGTLQLPDGATLSVPNGTTVPGDGELIGQGTVVNNGAVHLPTGQVDWQTLGLEPNNHLVSFNANGGTPASQVRVFATNFDAGARQLPDDPSFGPRPFDGWNTQPNGGGEPFTTTTTVDNDVTVYAQWGRAAQTIDFPAPAEVTFGDPPFEVQPTASSGLPVTVTADGPCTVDGTEVATTGAGSCELTATQDGNDAWQPAHPLIRTVQIAPAPAQINFGDLDQVYDGTPRPVDVVTVPAGLAVEVTYDGSPTPPTDAGDYPVVATVTDPNHTSEPDPITATLTISPAATTTVLAGPDEPTVVAGPATFVATVTGPDSPAGTVTFATDDGRTVDVPFDDGGTAVWTTDRLPVGDHEVTATYSGDGNHANSEAAPIAHEVVTAPLALTGLPDQVDVGEQVAVQLAGFLPGETITLTFESDPVQIATVTADTAGAATATVTVPDVTAGDHRLVATGADSGLSVAATTTVVAVAGLAATGQPVGLLAAAGLLLVAIGGTLTRLRPART